MGLFQTKKHSSRQAVFEVEGMRQWAWEVEVPVKNQESAEVDPQKNYPTANGTSSLKWNLKEFIYKGGPDDRLCF